VGVLRVEVQRLTVAKRDAEALAAKNQAIADAARAELANYLAAAAGGGGGGGGVEAGAAADAEKFLLRQQLQVRLYQMPKAPAFDQRILGIRQRQRTPPAPAAAGGPLASDQGASTRSARNSGQATSLSSARASRCRWGRWRVTSAPAGD